MSEHTPNLTPISNPTPKHRFRESADNISKHRTLIDNPAFQRAADFGMLQYQQELSLRNSSMNESAANALKLQGALEFLQTFRLLSEEPKMPLASARTDNLNHNLS